MRKKNENKIMNESIKRNDCKRKKEHNKYLCKLSFFSLNSDEIKSINVYMVNYILKIFNKSSFNKETKHFKANICNFCK